MICASERATGRGPAWLRRWSGGPESPGSNPGVPTRVSRASLPEVLSLGRRPHGGDGGQSGILRRQMAALAMPATPQPLQHDLARHPHPLAVGPEPEQGAEPDPEIQRDHILDLRGQAEGVVAEPEHCVLDQQADAVQHEECRALARGTRSFAVPEAPVPVPEEGEDGGRDCRDRDRCERAEPERAVKRNEDEVGDADPDRANDEELGAFVNELAEAPVHAGKRRQRHDPGGRSTRTRPLAGRNAAIAQRGFLASSDLGCAWFTWPDARASAGSIASCPSGAGCGAAQTHLRYDQNLNTVPRTMPTLLATTLASLPVSSKP